MSKSRRRKPLAETRSTVATTREASACGGIVVAGAPSTSEKIALDEGAYAIALAALEWCRREAIEERRAINQVVLRGRGGESQILVTSGHVKRRG